MNSKVINSKVMINDNEQPLPIPMPIMTRHNISSPTTLIDCEFDISDCASVAIMIFISSTPYIRAGQIRAGQIRAGL